MRFKTLAAICLLPILSACATPGTNIPTNIKRIEFPLVGQVSTTRPGESMLKKAKEYKNEALFLHNDFIVGDAILTGKVRIPAQKLKVKSVLNNHVVYIADEAYMTGFVGSERQILSGICIPLDPRETKWKAYLNGICSPVFVKNPPPYSLTEVYDSNNTSVVRELIYNGRMGNIVKVIYREFSNDVMRPSFQQELQYDMSQSNEIVFREAVLGVNRADNNAISFVVLRHFSDIN